MLGLWGQEFSIPQTGYQFHEDSWDLNGTIVIIVSHSGGTFSSLAVSNLVKAYTDNIFVISSEWDTQIGKRLRELSVKDATFFSRTFSTNVGLRPAEPCTLTVVATQQLLTEVCGWGVYCQASVDFHRLPICSERLLLVSRRSKHTQQYYPAVSRCLPPSSALYNPSKFTPNHHPEILIYLMRTVQKSGLEKIAGGKYNVADVYALNECSVSHLVALERITGFDRNGKPLDPSESTTAYQLVG